MRMLGGMMKLERNSILHQLIDNRTVGVPDKRPLVVRALFLSGRGVPQLPSSYRLIGDGRLTAIACEFQAAQMAGHSLPPGVACYPGIVPLRPEPQFDSVAAVRRALQRTEHQVFASLSSRAACFEQRVLLDELDGPVTDGPSSQRKAEEQSRMIAKFAQTITDLSQRVCLTPRQLLPAVRGEVRMALSLMVDDRATAAAEQEMNLAARLARAHGLRLRVSPPGPLESFPLSGWSQN